MASDVQTGQGSTLREVFVGASAAPGSTPVDTAALRRRLRWLLVLRLLIVSSLAGTTAMLVSAALFAVSVLLLGGFGLNGLFAAFTIYLGLRGITLQMRMGRVRALATPRPMDES